MWRSPKGPIVGRYHVDVAAFEGLALPAIRRAARRGGVVIIDELGQMELFSPAFIASFNRPGSAGPVRRGGAGGNGGVPGDAAGDHGRPDLLTNPVERCRGRPARATVRARPSPLALRRARSPGWRAPGTCAYPLESTTWLAAMQAARACEGAPVPPRPGGECLGEFECVQIVMGNMRRVVVVW